MALPSEVWITTWTAPAVFPVLVMVTSAVPAVSEPLKLAAENCIIGFGFSTPVNVTDCRFENV